MKRRDFSAIIGAMKSLPIGECQNQLPEIIDQVRSGEEVIITSRRENVAVIVPYAKYRPGNKIKLGLLADKKLFIADDFKMNV